MSTLNARVDRAARTSTPGTSAVHARGLRAPARTGTLVMDDLRRKLETMTDINPADIAARYIATDQWWTDMPEAKPRARARVADGLPEALIVVTLDGELHYDQDAGVEIDRYEDPAYAEVRAEGEARHGGADVR